MSYFSQNKLIQSLYAWILLFISGFAGGFISQFLGMNVDLFGMIISGGLVSAIMSLSANFLIVFIIDLFIFWYLHKMMIGNITLLQAILVFLLPNLVAGFLVGFIGELGGVIGIIFNFLVFHFIYQFIKSEV